MLNSTTVTVTPVYEFLVVMYCISKNAFSSNSIKIKDLHNKDPSRFAFHNFFYKMRPPSLYSMLKLSKMTTPQKLFSREKKNRF